MPPSRPRVRIRKDLTAQSLGISQQELGQREQITKERLDQTKGVTNPNSRTASEVLASKGLPSTPTEQRIAQQQEQNLQKQQTENITSVEGKIKGITQETQPTNQQQNNFVDEQGNKIEGKPIQTPQLQENQQMIDRNNLDSSLIAGAVATGGALGLGTASVLSPSFVTGLTSRTRTGLGNLGSIGAIFGLGSLATAFSAWTAGRQSTFENDVRDLQGSAKEWSRFALNGGDPELALDNIEDMESEMIRTLGKLHVSLKNDPRGRLKGKDIETFARRQLLALQNKKNAVLRYQQTGDKSQLNLIANSIDQNG